MKTLCYILGLSTLIFLCLWLDACNRLKDSELTAQAIRSVWEADKAISEKESEVWERKVYSLESRQAKKDSIHQVTNAAQTRVIHKLRRKEKLSRVDTVLLTVVDSLNAETDILLDSLRDQLRAAKEVDSVKTALHQKQLEIQDALIKKCDSLMNEIKIPPEPSRLSFGLSAGYGLMQTKGEIRAGMIFGPTLTYKIPIRLKGLFRRKR